MERGIDSRTEVLPRRALIGKSRSVQFILIDNLGMLHLQYIGFHEGPGPHYWGMVDGGYKKVSCRVSCENT